MMVRKPAEGRGECQICEGHFSNRTGTLAKHGYKRPGDGFLHGECYGAHRRPYTATDALVEYRKIIEGMLRDAKADLARFDGTPTFETKEEMIKYVDGAAVYEPTSWGGQRAVMYEAKVTWAPGVSCPYGYARKLEEERKPRERGVRRLVEEVKRCTDRIANGDPYAPVLTPSTCTPEPPFPAKERA